MPSQSDPHLSALKGYASLDTADEQAPTEDPKGPWKVKLTHFRLSGKYYTEGEYTSTRTDLWQIWDELRDMAAAGNRPGLVRGAYAYYTLAEVPGHPHNHPRLILPVVYDGGPYGRNV